MTRRIAISLLITFVLLLPALAQPKPTYRIAGTVVSAVTGQPISHVQVMFGIPQKPEALQTILTGDSGAFEFTGMVSGKYWLTGQASGSMRQDYERHDSYTSAIAVGDETDSTHLLFRLHPDAHIRGKLTDQENEPVAGARILLFRTNASEGYPRTLLVAEEMSDERGSYAFKALEAGRYYVAVAARPWFAAAVEQNEDALSPAQKALFNVAYPVTLYPGVIDEASATAITVEDGEEYAADVTLVAVPSVRVKVRGVVTAANDYVQLSLRRSVFNFQFDALQGTPPNGEASEILGVPVGRYVLNVVRQKPKPSTKSVAIDVNGDVEVDAGAALPPAIHGIIQNLASGAPEQSFVRLWNQRTGRMLETHLESGEFEFESGFVAPGDYSIFVFAHRLYSEIDKIAATGATVAGQTIRIGRAPVEFKITMCQRLSNILGTALSNGKPLAGLMVVLIPEDAEHNLPLFRRDQSDSDGTFTLMDVVPGKYKIVALDNAWNLEWARLAMAKAKSGPAVDIVISAPSNNYQAKVSVQ